MASGNDLPTTIARYVLGFANRHPDLALQHAQGTAYLVIGVEPGDVTGAEILDVADLGQRVTRYAGHAPRWSPTYVQVDGRSVFIVTVEPPEWGEDFHVLQKDFGPYKAGRVFIRKIGKTEEAGPADMEMLRERMRRKASPLAVEVEWNGQNPAVIPCVEMSAEDVRAWLDRQQAELLQSLGTELPDDLLLKLQHPYAYPEDRSPQEFREQVEEYLREVEPYVPVRARAAFLDAFPRRYQLLLRNLTDKNYMRVRVDLSIPGAIWAYREKGDAWEDAGPSAPRAYGAVRYPDYLYPPSMTLPNLAPPIVIDNGGSSHLRFERVDLGPEDERPLWSFYLVADGSLRGETVTCTWSARAENVDGVCRGEVQARVFEYAADSAKLLETERE